MQSVNNFPLWLKWPVTLLGIVLLFVILEYGQFILLPLAISALLAMLLEPLCNQFERLKVGRVGGILLSIVVVFAVLAGLIWLLSIQIADFAGELPQAVERLEEISRDIISFFQNTFGVAPERQIEFVRQSLEKLIAKSGQYITTVLSATTGIFSTLMLLPIFVFFLMYYKEMYYEFIYRVGSNYINASLEAMIRNIQSVSRNYLVGKFIVIIILSVLNALGLWIVGLNHFIFFAVFAAVLSFIPYIGVVIGSLPAVLYGLLFGSLWTAVAVIIVFVIVQFLEGNFITPAIVGSRVSINPFMIIIVLFIGGQLWGIVGMIISIPYLGMLKCVFDEVDELRPYGYLLGNNVEYEKEE